MKFFYQFDLINVSLLFAVVTLLGSLLQIVGAAVWKLQSSAQHLNMTAVILSAPSLPVHIRDVGKALLSNTYTFIFLQLDYKNQKAMHAVLFTHFLVFTRFLDRACLSLWNNVATTFDKLCNKINIKLKRLQSDV